MLIIIDPGKIKEEKSILSDLKTYGINHLTRSPSLGWNYVLDHVWLAKEIKHYLKKSGTNLRILDVGCGKSNFHNFIEERYQVDITGVDRPEGYCHQDKIVNVDILKDFLSIDDIADGSIDIIYWLSSIEHNDLGTIKNLYQKSMKMLKKNGLFLATLAISEETYWFEEAQQTNLSLETAKSIFEVEEIDGQFDVIKQKYRKNVLLLRSKYKRRFYGKFGLYRKDDPKYIVGGIKKTKVTF